MQVDSIHFRDKPIFLAPMEDVSDPPFRILCKRYGADLLYTEFISSGGLVNEAADSLKKLDFLPEERPVAIQIFGGDVDQVREAARIVDDADPDLVDINFGCPVRKVVCRDGGAGILRKPEKMRKLAQVVVEKVSRPVTVKTRLGWCPDSIEILDVAKMLQDVGIKALAVHARTRSQMYKGSADWSWLGRLKEDPSIHIPIIGNGDATSPERIRDMFSQTGVDAVMIGRGAIGNPWIFRDARALLDGREIPARPGLAERVSVALEHLDLKCSWLGERKGVLEMRKMYGGYFKGFGRSSLLRQALMQQETQDGLVEVLEGFLADQRASDGIPADLGRVGA